jgi:2-dehydropantoate 2-reductase
LEDDFLTMRHAILGAGGVGGTMAACLAHIGEDVTLVARPETLAAHPGAIEFSSTFGSWAADVEWASSVPSTDVLWLTVKATHLEWALRSIPDASSVGPVVPLLNGIDHIELLRSKFGVEGVIPATIVGEMERVRAGQFVHPSPFLILNISSRGRDLLGSIAEKLRGLGFMCNFIDDETTLMWSKLAILGPMALSTTAFDKPIGEILANPDRYRQFEGSVREACAAGAAEGAKVNADAVLKLMLKSPHAMRSSMQKDVENGRPPELDAIGGAIVRAANRHELKAPFTEELMSLVEQRVLAAKAASRTWCPPQE